MNIKSTAATEQETIVNPGTSGVTDEIVESAITCPSCNYTGEREFLICPRCGIIIKKYFNLKQLRFNAATLASSSEVNADEAGETTKSPKKVLLICSLAIALMGVIFYRVTTHSASSEPTASDMPIQSASAPNAPSGEEVLRTKEALKVYRESYLPAPDHKAFAQSPSGYFGWYTGKTSVEYAKEDALKACNQYDKNGEACVIVNVDGVWVKN